MALVGCDFYSDALEVGTSMKVVLPQLTETQVGVAAAAPGADRRCSTCCTACPTTTPRGLRYTSIERYATAAGLAVVMPAAGRSFYTDEPHGHPYWDTSPTSSPASLGRSSGSPDRRRPSWPGSRWAATGRSARR